MRKVSYLFFVTCLLAISHACSNKDYNLNDLQGNWWADCEGPSVEFSIKGTEYSGDFYGSHPLKLRKNILTFQNGFVEGHSVNVSFKPREYRILSLSNEAMLIESNLEKNNKHRWQLYSCLK